MDHSHLFLDSFAAAHVAFLPSEDYKVAPHAQLTPDDWSYMAQRGESTYLPHVSRILVGQDRMPTITY